jgi:hypothetical protein
MSKRTATDLRAMLDKLGLAQRAAARELQISEREMRRMCAGSQVIPNVVWLALEKMIEDRAKGGTK